MYRDLPSTPTPSSQAVHSRDSGDDPDESDPAASGDHPASPPPFPRDAAELRYRGMRLTLCGRALHLVLWLAGHQDRLNATASERGQIWMTWKGEGLRSIDGEFRTRL
jgi:hypothetical protein